MTTENQHEEQHSSGKQRLLYSRGLLVDGVDLHILIGRQRFPAVVVFLLELGSLVGVNDYPTSINLLRFCVSDTKVLPEALINPQISAFKVSQIFLTTDDSTGINRSTDSNNPASRNYQHQTARCLKGNRKLVQSLNFNSLKSWKLRVKRDLSLF